MTEPVQHGAHLFGVRALWQGGALHHDDGQAQGARRIEFAARGMAASILGHQPLNAVCCHQSLVMLSTKGATPQHHRGVLQGQTAGLGLIHQPQQILMLGLMCESRQLLAAHGQKHTRSRLGQGLGCSSHISYASPSIASLRLPGRALQRQQGHAGFSAGLAGIAAHLRGKRVGGIDHMADALLAHELHQPGHTTKATAARGQGLCQRLTRHSRIRKPGLHTSLMQSLGQLAGTAGTAQQENMRHD